jgi:hypothetical protein
MEALRTLTLLPLPPPPRSGNGIPKTLKHCPIVSLHRRCHSYSKYTHEQKTSPPNSTLKKAGRKEKKTSGTAVPESRLLWPIAAKENPSTPKPMPHRRRRSIILRRANADCHRHEHLRRRGGAGSRMGAQNPSRGGETMNSATWSRRAGRERARGGLWNGREHGRARGRSARGKEPGQTYPGMAQGMYRPVKGRSALGLPTCPDA